MKLRSRHSRRRVIVLAAALLVLGAGIVAGRGAPPRPQGSVPEMPPRPGRPHHEMSPQEMRQWVDAWYGAHPARGAVSTAAAADTFTAQDYFFDSDGTDQTQVDTVRIQVGETVLWRWLGGSHTTTSGEGFEDPELGMLWDMPLTDTDTTFAFQFDLAGTYPFFCRPHYFFDMRGVVIVGEAAPDTVAPSVTVTSPNGGEVLAAHSGTSIAWVAVDDEAVAAVDLSYRDADGRPWVTLARELPNTGGFIWFVHNTPTNTARVRVVARDAAGNAAADTSDGGFSIARVAGGIVGTTLRDFIQPGTQPLDGGRFESSTTCLQCHGGYDPNVEPGAWQGTMMSQSTRDPLFYACLAVAEQDAPSSGDLCLRCHSPIGWLSGRSIPTDGSRITALDRDGVACDVCHRAVDPLYRPGVSPPDDATVLSGLLPAHRPTGYANGQYVMDARDAIKRGPFNFTAAPHPTLDSDFHRRSDFCGTCHDVSNPVFARTGADDFAPGPLDQPADSIGSTSLMPIERTYSEWKASAFPAGVYAPEFAGAKPFGIVSTCQDCHERDAVGRGCNPGLFPNAPVRSNLPFHDMMGGNAWMPLVIAKLAALYPGEVDSAAQTRASARAVSMLQKAAVLDLSVESEGDSFRAVVTVTNRSGHKLPTGYPEGRRMWLQITARDAGGAPVYRSGVYDAATGVLHADPDLVVYEAHLGLSPGFANAIRQPAGTSFHFVLNDTLYKDNRIPPLGFTHAAFAAFGGAPVDDTRPGPRYPDGQNWDTSRFRLPRGARSVTATLCYQTTSKEYVEFLRDANTTNDAGQRLYDLWAANDRARPVVMATDSMSFEPPPIPLPAVLALRTLANPAHDAVSLHLDLPRPAPVELEVFDARGRRVASRSYGSLGGGAHRLSWDGRDRHGQDAGAGTFWVRVHVGRETLVRKIVRLR